MAAKVIVGVETAGRDGSVALVRCTEGTNCETLALEPLTGRSYSAELIPKLAAMLSAARLDKSHIDSFAAGTGPGSFTGLRVGLSTIKALAEVLLKPIAPVSLLEAMAWTIAPAPSVMVALDAGRDQVFVGEYLTRSVALPTPLRESLLSLEELARELNSTGHPVYTPDRGLMEIVKAWGTRAVFVERPRADTIARLGSVKLVAGQGITPEALDANYIRRSDAEVFAKPGA